MGLVAVLFNLISAGTLSLVCLDKLFFRFENWTASAKHIGKCGSDIHSTGVEAGLNFLIGSCNIFDQSESLSERKTC